MDKLATLEKFDQYVDNCLAQDANTVQPQLILDGTGPRITLHLPYLIAMQERLVEFKKVHAFSGGIMAYLVARAHTLNGLRYPVSDYSRDLDKVIRRSHKQPAYKIPIMVKRFFSGAPVYERPVYMDLATYAFKDEFLQTHVHQVAPALIAYVGDSRKSGPVPITNTVGINYARLTVSELMQMALKIPFLYRDPEGTAFYDATYAPGFLALRRRLIDDSARSLLLTMWDTDTSSTGSELIRIYSGKRPKRRVQLDILHILFNVPNSHYRKDIQRAFC